MTDDAQTSGAQPQAALMLLHHYVKDLSFENPNALRLGQLREQPKMEVGVDLQGRRLNEETVEVELKINIAAKGPDFPLFVLELVYGGIFTARNIPEQHLERVLLVDCAFLVFPHARLAIAEMVRSGGYQPLILDPIDFVTLYNNRQNQGQAAATADA